MRRNSVMLLSPAQMCASTGKANPSDWCNTIHGNLVMWVRPHVDDYMHNRFKEQLLIAIAINCY